MVINKHKSKPKTKRRKSLVNLISKVYELVKITQNEKNNSKMSEIQTAGRKRGQQWII